jgi:hypothetical protein
VQGFKHILAGVGEVKLFSVEKPLFLNQDMNDLNPCLKRAAPTEWLSNKRWKRL